jgi:AsmA family
MTDDVQGRQRKRRRRLWLALALLLALLAVLIAPPMISLGRYKNAITQLLSASLGKPVRLSSVELRLLPRPGFVLTDLTVEDDPAYGAEPVLHANTVTASFRLLSMWRGKLEISRISVDEASLNLVRTDAGRWNLDSFFRTAAAHAGDSAGSEQTGSATAAGSAPAGGVSRRTPFPYLEATNSRINFKNGAEKLPLSLVSTDLSFWQDEPGDWRIRLRGQPARTDVSLNLGDTGIVQLELSLKQAAELRQMPLHLDMEWREAQLGQLSRLVIGSDEGWRGDLRGELHLDGTADAAQINTRLRATGIHREEFAPPEPLDFDATCAFLYHFSGRALENLKCDSPLGDGRIHVNGEMPSGGHAKMVVELDRIPVAAGLDALRTVRNGFGPGLEARGTISGRIIYDESTPEKIVAATNTSEKPTSGTRRNITHSGRAHPAEQGPLEGSLTIDGFELSGDGLNAPLLAPKLVLKPVVSAADDRPSGHAQSTALSGTAAVAAGGSSPILITPRLTLSGYQVTARGDASITRVKELAHIAGLADASSFDSLAGEPAVLDLNFAGPWVPAQLNPNSIVASAPAAASPAGLPAGQPAQSAQVTEQDDAAVALTDGLSGTVTLHNANWKTDYLASHVEIDQATLHLDRLSNGEARWDPVVFSYGPVKGTASLTLPAGCAASEPCPVQPVPRFAVQFGDLDAAVLQAAILGVHEPGSLLSQLIDRLRPANVPAWPRLEGTVNADSLVLGPIKLQDVTAEIGILPTGADISSLDGSLLGGQVHATGTLHAGVKADYALECEFDKLSPAAVGSLMQMRWAGGTLDGDGKIELSGFTANDLAESAKGTLHFEWRHGDVLAYARNPAASSTAVQAEKPLQTTAIPAELARFDRWAGDLEIAGKTITLKQNEVQQGSRKRAVEAAVSLTDSPQVTFVAAKELQAKKK